MKIFQNDTYSRLKDFGPFDQLPIGAKYESSYFLIIHPPDDMADEENIKEQSIDKRMSDPNCKGILYLRGLPFAGLVTEKAKEIENHHNNKVHFLSYSVGQSGIHDSARPKFERFFQAIKEKDEIDWKLIEENWPQYLLAAYILSLVVYSSQDDDDVIDHMIAQQGSWQPIWDKAKQEYLSYTDAQGGKLDQMAFEPDDSQRIFKKLKRKLEFISGRSS